MKKLFMVAAIFSVVMISSTALAANWVYITTNEESGFDTYVDKDSIRHGITSKNFTRYNRSDGFSAYVDLRDNKSTIFLVGFWRENGKKHCKFLDAFEGNGTPLPYEDNFSDNSTEINERDTEALMVFDYVESNLP